VLHGTVGSDLRALPEARSPGLLVRKGGGSNAPTRPVCSRSLQRHSWDCRRSVAVLLNLLAVCLRAWSNS